MNGEKHVRVSRKHCTRTHLEKRRGDGERRRWRRWWSTLSATARHGIEKRFKTAVLRPDEIFEGERGRVERVGGTEKWRYIT